MIKKGFLTYGVIKECNKNGCRFYIMCDNVKTKLYYTNKNFAMKKAREFCKLVMDRC